MVQTNNLNVFEVTPIIAPSDLKQVFPLTIENAQFVDRARKQIENVLHGKDHRLMVVVGPCSIHQPKSALEYARKLAQLAKEVEDQLLIVMRVYFEKPRTTIGWKGLINDPDLDGSHRISKGLGVARRLFCAITDLGLPIASEMLDPITPQFLSDIISWGAIGARTTESQTHREMASGLSFPVGFKNGTDGSLKVATDAMKASLNEHSFLGINYEGKTSIVHTKGNPNVHLVLRGGENGPNYDESSIHSASLLLKENQLPQSIMVDCSHANSNKDHHRQGEVLHSVLDQILSGNTALNSVMLESNLYEGNQSIPQNLSELKYGVSLTDKCIDWATTETLLKDAAKKLAGRG